MVKILLAVDGSRYSDASAGPVMALKAGRKAEVTLLTVIPEHVFLGGHTLTDLLGRSAALKTQVRKAAKEGSEHWLTRLRFHSLQVS